LALEHNDFSSTISPVVGDLTNLQHLKLGNNYFLEGTLPSSLSNLTNLKTFAVDLTELSGPLFDIALQWPELEFLSLGATKFTGTIPTEIAEFKHLNYFQIFNTLFEGTIPNEMMSLTMLKELSLSGPNWNSTLPENIGDLESLGK
jgi:hypothetical protein